MIKLCCLFLTIDWNAIAAIVTLVTGALAFGAARSSAIAAKAMAKIEMQRFEKEKRYYDVYVTTVPFYELGKNTVTRYELRIAFVNYSNYSLNIPGIDVTKVSWKKESLITNKENIKIGERFFDLVTISINADQLQIKEVSEVFIKIYGISFKPELSFKIDMETFEKDRFHFHQKLSYKEN